MLSGALAYNSPQSSNGVYSLQHKGSNKYVSAGLSKENSVGTYLWEWAGNADQKFTLTRLSDGTYSIASNYSGKVLDVAGISMARAAGVSSP
ncbi:MAG: RICIN domain-containing protein [Oscillospiraceae bacterium]|jgi:hypothetical protein|nr:RICIN domain-containing protein [Oscillospiraceae bacterium]